MWILILTIVGTGMSSVHSILFNTYDSCEKARIVWVNENTPDSRKYTAVCVEK